MLVGGRSRALQHLVATVVIVLLTAVLPGAFTAAGASGDGTIMVVVERSDDGGLRVRTFEVRNDGSATYGAASAGDPGVLAVEPIGTVQAFAEDPYRAGQWALDRLDYETAWATADGTGVVVAVIDTGVRATHEDLAGQVLPGNDFVDPGGDGTLADHYHGSHVAGIIAAVADNGVGVSGAAPGVKILPVRVLNSSGSGTTAAVASGIIWAVDNGADVVNLSLGSSADSSVIRSAVDYAEANDVVVVAAAGNAAMSGNPTTYPAAIDDVVAVGATASDDSRSYFSNYGSWVDLAGPGSNIQSLHGSGDSSYASASGTSMATPYVAAAAALVRAASPGLTAAQVREVLAATAIDLGPAGHDVEFGDGLVDPLAAVAGGLAGPDSGWGTTPPPTDYQVVTSLGRVVAPNAAQGAAAGPPLNAPVVGGAPTPTGAGHWLVASDGGIFAYGDARFHGSTGNITLNQPIVGMAATPTGNGYWLAASDGGIFAFGDAAFHGSTGNITLNQPIVGMAATPTGNGYWLAASDGGIFAFGDAAFHGSTGNITLNQPIVGMAATPTGNGYWLTASDGGIFAFGDAAFYGSTGNITLNQPIAGMAPTPTGGGYWLAASDGGIFTYGDATYQGSLAGQLDPGEFVVGMLLDEST
jgi:type VII secretion-associated serine protease mycosin